MGGAKVVLAKRDWWKGTEECVLGNCGDGGDQYVQCTQSSGGSWS